MACSMVPQSPKDAQNPSTHQQLNLLVTVFGMFDMFDILTLALIARWWFLNDICIYIYISLYIHVYTNIPTHTCIHIYIDIYICTEPKQLYIIVHNPFIYISMYVYMRTCVDIHVCVYIYI